MWGGGGGGGECVRAYLRECVRVCVCVGVLRERGDGVNTITDVLCIMCIILVCVKRFVLSHVMDTALWKCYVSLLFISH